MKLLRGRRKNKPPFPEGGSGPATGFGRRGARGGGEEDLYEVLPQRDVSKWKGEGDWK